MAKRIVPPEEPTRQVSDSPRPRRPRAEELIVDSGRRARPKSSRPAWAEATEHFAHECQRLDGVRTMETRGHCQRYLNAHFFGPQASNPKSVDEVKALMSRFVDDVVAGRQTIKPGQSAWMRFTGVWGR